ncbi:uncharacterized protein LACBIDRAFT_304308 [Laccaria bicolor S238N-H82]|uniref:Predicted protein n=1 Tax=Laccaria bicolor (strain S238N-H82 / ATCC MYA-4686) TaxID=486041 RepID=B0DLC2_LACBS|nr:uncharacterized protein LACBIDRAFT_304308 [Laccaria bicolor S238N-H82]EDR04626.1 predicted protein [Laccaria bicolor S238N-H82]|eukprot:XP_001884798.1 predicted protein [Laccaria bicolor S238N-H82]
MVGESCPARSAELEGMISIRGDVDARGTIVIAFLLLLTVPSVPPPKKKPPPSPRLFVHALHELW